MARWLDDLLDASPWAMVLFLALFCLVVYILAHVAVGVKKGNYILDSLTTKAAIYETLSTWP